MEPPCGQTGGWRSSQKVAEVPVWVGYVSGCSSAAVCEIAPVARLKLDRCSVGIRSVFTGCCHIGFAYLLLLGIRPGFVVWNLESSH